MIEYNLNKDWTKTTLYKYRPCNMRLINLLANCELYFPDYQELNDPYDCQIDIDKAVNEALNRLDQCCPVKN